MDDPFSGIRLKLARARSQANELQAEFLAYLNTDPYQTRVDFNRTTRILITSVDIKKIPNPMWGVKIGEIVHNLRSSLDHFIWQLVILETGRTPRLPSKNQFPIFKTEAGFKSRGITDQLRGVGQNAIDLIESEQPFSTGEDIQSPLWHLRELSNTDKHHTLHVTGTMLGGFELSLPPLLEKLSMTVLQVSDSGPIQQDIVLRKVHLSGNLDWPFDGTKMKGHLAVNIAFDERTPAVGGWLVFGTLIDIADRVDRIQCRIAKKIFSVEL